MSYWWIALPVGIACFVGGMLFALSGVLWICRWIGIKNIDVTFLPE